MSRMRFITDVPVGEFVALLKIAACLVGNSSAGIKECSFLGTPVVNMAPGASFTIKIDPKIKGVTEKVVGLNKDSPFRVTRTAGAGLAGTTPALGSMQQRGAEGRVVEPGTGG